MGSPPRMRERQCRALRWWCVLRITPAYAGKTIYYYRKVKKTWDHPRVCGKDRVKTQNIIIALGSPPRMRERPLGEENNRNTFRITPAYAGKTDAKYGNLFTYRDHPRVCGKDSTPVFANCLRRGSPPRMRERRCGYSNSCTDCRITPAYAGKTCFCTPCHESPRDHPRVCGKDSIYRECVSG